jgi:hypothetical protein
VLAIVAVVVLALFLAGKPASPGATFAVRDNGKLLLEKSSIDGGSGVDGSDGSPAVDVESGGELETIDSELYGGRGGYDTGEQGGKGAPAAIVAGSFLAINSNVTGGDGMYGGDGGAGTGASDGANITSSSIHCQGGDGGNGTVRGGAGGPCIVYGHRNITVNITGNSTMDSGKGGNASGAASCGATMVSKWTLFLSVSFVIRFL